MAEARKLKTAKSGIASQLKLLGNYAKQGNTRRIEAVVNTINRKLDSIPSFLSTPEGKQFKADVEAQINAAQASAGGAQDKKKHDAAIKTITAQLRLLASCIKQKNENRIKQQKAKIKKILTPETMTLLQGSDAGKKLLADVEEAGALTEGEAAAAVSTSTSTLRHIPTSVATPSIASEPATVKVVTGTGALPTFEPAPGISKKVSFGITKVNKAFENCNGIFQKMEGLVSDNVDLHGKTRTKCIWAQQALGDNLSRLQAKKTSAEGAVDKLAALDASNGVIAPAREALSTLIERATEIKDTGKPKLKYTEIVCKARQNYKVAMDPLQLFQGRYPEEFSQLTEILKNLDKVIELANTTSSLLDNDEGSESLKNEVQKSKDEICALYKEKSVPLFEQYTKVDDTIHANMVTENLRSNFPECNELKVMVEISERIRKEKEAEIERKRQEKLAKEREIARQKEAVLQGFRDKYSAPYTGGNAISSSENWSYTPEEKGGYLLNTQYGKERYYWFAEKFGFHLKHMNPDGTSSADFGYVYVKSNDDGVTYFTFQARAIDCTYTYDTYKTSDQVTFSHAYNKVVWKLENGELKVIKGSDNEIKAYDNSLLRVDPGFPPLLALFVAICRHPLANIPKWRKERGAEYMKPENVLARAKAEKEKAEERMARNKAKNASSSSSGSAMAGYYGIHCGCGFGSAKSRCASCKGDIGSNTTPSVRCYNCRFGSAKNNCVGCGRDHGSQKVVAMVCRNCDFGSSRGTCCICKGTVSH